MGNHSTWESTEVVTEYLAAAALQPAEARIFGEFAAQLPRLHILDIGIGTGRTTLHLADAVGRYVGIDYSAAMIAASRDRLQSRFPRAEFSVGDATALAAFADHEFDFVLFSFNGIDYVAHTARERIYAEVRRVLRPDGWFCFSSHNLRSVAALLRLRSQVAFTRNPYWLARDVFKWLNWRLRHGPRVSWRTLQAQPYALINDGAHDNTLETYYIQPSEQLRQLEPAFRDTRVFSGATGAELAAAELATSSDPWLYYLSRPRPIS